MATTTAARNVPDVAKRYSAVILTANSNRDGTGALGPIATVNATLGNRIDGIQIAALGATSAGMVRLYVNGVLIDEITVPATTPNGTVATWLHSWTPPTGELYLNNGDVLQASTQNSESFALTAFGWQF